MSGVPKAGFALFLARCERIRLEDQSRAHVQQKEAGVPHFESSQCLNLDRG